MTRDDERVVRQGEQLRSNRAEDGVVVPAPEVRPSDAATKESVAREHARPFRVLHDEAAAAWRVPGCVKDGHLERTDPYRGSVYQGAIHVGDDGQLGPQELSLDREEFVKEPVGFVNAGGRARSSLELGGAAHVIDVRVRVDDRLDGQAEGVELGPDRVEVAAGIDHEGALRAEVRDDAAIAAQRTDGQSLDVKHASGSSTR
jgi:hypothetical protein